MSDPFVTKTATLTNADVDLDESTVGFHAASSLSTLEPAEVEQHDRAEVLAAVDRVEAAQAEAQANTTSERPRTKRRIVTKVEVRHVAQEMLMHGIGDVLGYWHEKFENLDKLKELGIDQEQFGQILLEQADRVAKTLKFERAWSN